MEPNTVNDGYDGDVILYYGEISIHGYHLLSDILEKKKDKNPKVCLILTTNGGDPNAAFRIARSLNHYYKSGVEILIPDVCKSAGTLICIGASKLIIGDRGELGPLDVQLSKQNEMFENMSGLTIFQALSVLQQLVIESFKSSLFNVRIYGKLSTKIAADVAAKLADGFISPIMEKIDPVTLGEHQRAMLIATNYGERLNNDANSLNIGALNTLTSGYPSHAFVIDRREARSLFTHVFSPEGETQILYEWMRNFIKVNPNLPDPPMVRDIGNSKEENKNDTNGRSCEAPTGGTGLEEERGNPEK
ncbi:MAG: SppA protein [Desulfobulbaceae bacterium]|nr:SppA protein [Desulfobulbaceae bacterium]